MDWFQKKIIISQSQRGFLLITDDIIKQVPEISEFKIGNLYLFLKHTSASLTINENADPTVREDLEQHFNHSVPENAPFYQHTMEGPDDMPAHIKTSLTNTCLSLSFQDGKIMLGTWQAVYLWEHRFDQKERIINVHIIGEKK